MSSLQHLIHKRRAGFTLDQLIEEILRYPQLLTSYQLEEILSQIGASPALGILDMTTDLWRALTVEQQMAYAQSYQRWYANERQLPGIREQNEIYGLLTLIPPGKFAMGNPERYQQEITLSAFWCGTHEVTQEDWEHLIGYNISETKGPNYPVSQIDHAHDIDQFLEKTNSSLLDMAEWEYACRAGTTTDYFFGETAKQLGDYAWYTKNSHVEGSVHPIHPVGEKLPNAWGLYDMQGNVHELCRSSYVYRREIIPTLRVSGSCCVDDAQDCRSFSKFAFEEGYLPQYRYLGLRIRMPV